MISSRYLVIVILLIAVRHSCFGQVSISARPVQLSGTIQGIILEKTSAKPMSGVAVMAKTKDSVLLGYTFTNDKGAYTLAKLPFGREFKLFVSSFGYRSDTSGILKMSFPGTKPVIVNWELSEDATLLNEVAIKGRKVPFVIRKDTLEFDATAFRLLPHAILEDLLRQLPGVVIHNDGSITVNGKKATKIKVDGKDFFGGNTSIATQNLPASIIDKIQVTAAENPDRKFNKMLNPAEDDVTINLLLKKGQNKGLLGNLSAGYGTMDRYTGNGMLSSLGGSQRYGIFGSAGNGTLSAGSGQGGVLPGTGNSRMALGGTLSTNKGSSLASLLNAGNKSAMISKGGLNDRKNLSGTFNTELGKKLKIEGNYNYNDQKNNSEIQTERFNFLESGELVYRESRSGFNSSSGQTYTVNLDYTPDTLTNLRIIPTWNGTGYNKQGNSRALTTTAEGREVNASENFTESKGNRNDIGNALFFGRKSGDGKTGFSLNWNINGGKMDESLSNHSRNEFSESAISVVQPNLDQKGSSEETKFSNDVTVQVSRNLGQSLTGALSYRLNQESGQMKKNIFDFNNATNRYDMEDSLQSGNSRSSNIQQTAFFQLAYNKERFNIALNAGMRFINQRNELFIQDTIIRNHQQQFAPKLLFNYSFKNNGALNLSYDISSSAPTVDQLSPITDISNPLIVIKGNPFLKTTIGHNINLGFNRFVTAKGTSMNVNAGASITRDQIIQDITYDTQGRQIQSFRNVDGYRSLRFSGGVQRAYHLRGLSVQPSINFSLNNMRDVGFINSKRNETSQWQYGVNAGINLNYREFLSLSPTANIACNQTDFSLADRDDLNYNIQNYSLMLKFSPAGRVEFGSQLSYQYNTQIPDQFQRSATVLNSSLTCRFLQKEQLSFKLFVNDLFNNGINTATVVTPSFRESTSVNALRRYFLFSVQYNFNTLSGAAAAKTRIGSK